MGSATLQHASQSFASNSIISRSLGSWVVPFCPFCLRVPLLKLSIGKKGTHIVKGLLPRPREDPKSRSLNGGSYKVPLVV